MARAETFEKLLSVVAKGLEYGDIADRTSLTERTLFAWRSGAGKRPHRLSYEAFARAFDLDPERVRKAIVASARAGK